MADICHVLLVEDRQADARLIHEMLSVSKHARFRVTSVISLAAAVEQLRNRTTPTDIILLDLSLPDSRGLGSMTAIRQAAPAVPIVVLTATDDEQLAVEAVRCGAQDWLIKTQVNTQLLERALRYAIQRHEMQQDLKQSEERFRELADNMTEVFWTREHQTHQLTYLSPAFETVWGRPRADAYERSGLWFDAIHRDQQSAVQKAYERIESTGKLDIEYCIFQPDGAQRWVRDRGVPIQDATGQVYRIAGITEDITLAKDLQRQIAELTMHEQRRIGQELHDSLGQQLTGIGLLAKTLERKLEAAGSPISAAASDLEENVSIAQRQLRKLVKGLIPVEVDADGIMTALDKLARTTERLCNVVCTFHCSRPVALEDNNTAMHLFHIVQEAVHNAVRHAEAQHITIHIAETEGALLLQVDDDGIGLPEPDRANDGMGMRIMNHRASVVGAVVEMSSNEKGGTKVVCTLPRDQAHVHSKT